MRNAFVNLVGYANTGIPAGDRAMVAPATFLPVGGKGENITLGDIKQKGGYPSLYTVGVYGNNVNCLAEYWYFDAETAGGMGYEEGWYELMEDPDIGNVPNFEKGVQNAVELPYGQGCVITSGDDDITYENAGEVTSVNEEFSIPSGDRKMTGNVLPRTINISELKQMGGYPSLYTLGTYGNNVNCEAEYWFFDAETAGGMGYEEGWYELMEDPDIGNVPNFEKGPATIDFAPGQGFVVTSGDDDITLRFPKAIAE